jgi:hypothetical protein
MLIDPQHRFVTGRILPSLVQVRATPHGDGLRVEAPGQSPLHLVAPSSERIEVRIWADSVSAVDAGDAAAAWFSAYAGRPLRLVYADPAMHRPVSPSYAVAASDEVAFPDGYPILLLTRAAVDALSERVGRPMDARRFRANLLIDGAAAHAEDGWRKIRIGEVELAVVKPCVRCVFTTVDPELAVREPDGEPLTSLQRYRAVDKGVTFGQNAIPLSGGTVRLGDPVEVLA